MPSPTAGQYEQVREVTGETSLAYVTELVDALTDAQWTATLADLAEWAARRDKYAELDGKVKLRPEDRKLAIRVRVRTRLGLSEYIDPLLTGAYPGSVAVGTEFRW